MSTVGKTILLLDVTSAEQIQAAAGQAGSFDILINNAGVAAYDDLTGRAVLERSLEVNLFGPHAVLTGPTDNGEEDIFPDPMSVSVADGWRNGSAKAMERHKAAFVPLQPAAA